MNMLSRRDQNSVFTDCSHAEDCPNQSNQKENCEKIGNENQKINYSQEQVDDFELKGEENSDDNDSNVSFEENILDEHKICLKQSLSIFLNCFNSNLVKQNNREITVLEDGYLNQGEYDLDLEEFLNEDFSLIPQNWIPHFLAYLQTEKKLQKFLLLIIQDCPQFVSRELVYIAFKIWQLYMPLKSQGLNEKELLDLPQKFMDSIFRDISLPLFGQELISFIDGADAKLLVAKERSTFLTFFCSTVILVIEHFFKNPYYKKGVQANLIPRKRHTAFNWLDEDEEDLRKIEGRKIIKKQNLTE